MKGVRYLTLLVLMTSCAYHSRPVMMQDGRVFRERSFGWSVTSMQRGWDETGVKEEYGTAVNGLFDWKKALALTTKDVTSDARMSMDIQDLTGQEKAQLIAVPLEALVGILQAAAASRGGIQSVPTQ